MKKIWSLFFVIGLITTLFLATQLYKAKEDYDSIYLTKANTEAISVTDQPSHLSVNALNKEINSFTKANKINLYRQFYNESVSSQYNKTVYVSIGDINGVSSLYDLSKNDSEKLLTNGTLSTKNNEIKFFNPITNVQLTTLKNAENEGLTGYYFIQSDTPEKIKKTKDFLLQKGLIFEDVKKISRTDLIDTIMSENMIVPLIISILIFLITFIFISFFEVMQRFKEIAIYQTLGYNNRQIKVAFIHQKLRIIIYMILISICAIFAWCLWFNGGIQIVELFIFSTVFIVVYLLSVLFIYYLCLISMKFITINLMIKGKKPYHKLLIVQQTFKFLCLAILLILSIHTTNEIRQLNYQIAQLETFNTVKKFNTTRISITTASKDAEEVVEDKIHSLNTALDKKGSFILSPSNFYLNPAEFGDNSDELPYVLVSLNYFKANPQLGIDYAQLKQSLNNKGDLVALFPDNYRLDKDVFKKNLTELLILSKKTPPHVLSKTYPHQKIPIYDYTFTKFSDTNIESPIFVVFDSKKASPSTISSAYSNGLAFLNLGENDAFKKLTPLLEKYKLVDNIRNINNVKKTVTQQIVLLQNELNVRIFTLLTLTTVLLITLFFITNLYIEYQQKMLAVKKCHGYNLLQRHIFFLLTELLVLLAVLVSVSLMITLNSRTLIFIAAALMITFIITLFFVIVFEKNSINKVMKGE